MTTPIMNILDIAQQPPYVVSWSELEKFQRAISSLYEQQTKEDREAFLIDDYISLILRHRLSINQIQSCIENVARLLLSVADGLNTRLPESIIKKCQNSTNNSTRQLYEIIRETYNIPSRMTQFTDDGCIISTETPPATKEPPQKVNRKRGRPLKNFEDFFNSKEEAEKIIPILRELIMDKSGRDVARFIAACVKGGWMTEPTSASVEREFGISEKGLNEPFRCHFRKDEAEKMASPKKPKFPSFADEELNPIIDIIKNRM